MGSACGAASFAATVAQAVVKNTTGWRQWPRALNGAVQVPTSFNTAGAWRRCSATAAPTLRFRHLVNAVLQKCCRQ